MILPAAIVITLDVQVCAARTGYRATFTGPNAEDHAIAFVNARSHTHAFDVPEDRWPADSSADRLLERLYPSCEHGLSAWLCAGPQHYPMDM